MPFEWDQQKALSNVQKHRVRFADAVAVFDDPKALTIDDPVEEEQRFATVGLDTLARVLVVVYTWRGDSIRIISARKATRRERAEYLKSES